MGKHNISWNLNKTTVSLTILTTNVVAVALADSKAKCTISFSIMEFPYLGIAFKENIKFYLYLRLSAITRTILQGFVLLCFVLLLP